MELAFQSIKRHLGCCCLPCGIALSFLIVQPYIARAEYKPPMQQSTYSGPGTTTGRRGGCASNAGASLTALAPRQHVGQSVATHPTFIWYVPDQDPLPLEFQLYEQSSTCDLLIHAIQLQSLPGLMQWSLPSDQPGLAVGQRYIWQVVMFCDLNRPSSALVARAELDVIAMPSSFAVTLASTQDPTQRADLYANAGFWYDALAEITQPASDVFLAQRVALLKELAALEIDEASGSQTAQGKQLQQILDSGGLSQR